VPNWTADQDAELTKLWADPDMSTTQIASVMGFPSRNKVIGRAYRLGLQSRKPAGKNTFKNKTQSAEQTAMLRCIKSGKPRGQFSVKINHAKGVAPEPPPPLNVADSEIPAAQRRNISSLTNETCRWPIGVPGTPGFFFCGHATADVDRGQPYCATHAKRAFSGQGGQP
jgi:GcrA cell cycle regulator